MKEKIEEILGAVANWGQTFCEEEVEIPITQYGTLPLTHGVTQLLHLVEKEKDKSFREGQQDCREGGDPTTHKYFKQATNEAVRSELENLVMQEQLHTPLGYKSATGTCIPRQEIIERLEALDE